MRKNQIFTDPGDGVLVGGRLAKIERVLQALSDYYGIDVAAAIEEGKARASVGS